MSAQANPDGSGGRQLLGQILKAQAGVKESSIQRSLTEQRQQGGLIGQILVAMGAATMPDVTRALAEQAGLHSIDLTTIEVDPDVLAMVDKSTAHTFGVLPIKLDGGTLVVALADPQNQAVLDDLSFSVGSPVSGVLADPESVRAKVLECYGEEESLADVLAAAQGVDASDPEAAAQSKPVVRLLNSILHRAIKDLASDIHFETYDNSFRIRYRVDGSLYEVESPPHHLAVPLISRIKVMADLDITEIRLPQDGRIELSIDGRPVDLRVATMPGLAGEGAVLRILDRSAVNLNLAALGLPEKDESTLRALTRLPHGVVLITGPTGSGKTTTLYGMLSEANEPDVKIITVEDPVEYDIEGIVQVPIHEDIGVTYASVLRSILRQDPDKILVGEIRDRETAAIAVEASLTGHTVFATVHTNDSTSTVARLMDMGIEPFLLTATLEAVAAQRLLRTVCEGCSVEMEPDEETLRELGPDARRIEGCKIRHGRGCNACHHTGYKGRTGIFEILLLDDDLRSLIQEGASSEALRQAAIGRGMRTLRDAGLDLVAEGRTTVEEVMRETLL